MVRAAEHSCSAPEGLPENDRLTGTTPKANQTARMPSFWRRAICRRRGQRKWLIVRNSLVALSAVLGSDAGRRDLCRPVDEVGQLLRRVATGTHAHTGRRTGGPSQGGVHGSRGANAVSQSHDLPVEVVGFDVAGAAAQ
jgi:hypothetical protein